MGRRLPIPTGPNFPIDDPLRARYAEFASANSVVILVIEAFMALMYAAILATNLSLGVDITGAVTILVGLLFAAIGAVLDQFRPNWFVGIRTPWTLSSERAWVATHHGERPVFVVMGAALVLAGLTQSPLMLYAAISICILGMLGLVAYSFVVWRQDPSHHRLTWRVVLPATALQ